METLGVTDCKTRSYSIVICKICISTSLSGCRLLSFLLTISQLRRVEFRSMFYGVLMLKRRCRILGKEGMEFIMLVLIRDLPEHGERIRYLKMTHEE